MQGTSENYGNAQQVCWLVTLGTCFCHYTFNWTWNCIARLWNPWTFIEGIMLLLTLLRNLCIKSAASTRKLPPVCIVLHKAEQDFLPPERTLSTSSPLLSFQYGILSGNKMADSIVKWPFNLFTATFFCSLLAMTWVYSVVALNRLKPLPMLRREEKLCQLKIQAWKRIDSETVLLCEGGLKPWFGNGIKVFHIVFKSFLTQCLVRCLN